MADGSLTPLNIRVVTPGKPDELRARALKNEARRIPDAMPMKSCVIVSSGPSADSEALWRRLQQNPDTVTVAVNGALKLFTDRNLAPTIWACCDPQDLVLDFLPKRLPRSTAYMVATKCTPALFDFLESQNLNVQKWRLDDDFSPAQPDILRANVAVSITLTVQSLMRFKGYHRFEHYGWDACYVDGRHHAGEQPDPALQAMSFTLQTEDGHQYYTCQTNGSWVAELHDAGLQGHNLNAMNYEVVVHGSHAIAHLLGFNMLAKTPDVDLKPILMHKLIGALAERSPLCQALGRPIRLAI